MSASASDHRVDLGTLLFVTVVCIATVGCEDSSPVPQSTTVSGAAPATVSAPAETSMGALMRLVRYLDYWPAGKSRTIMVRQDANGKVVDDAGNVIDISAAEWNGMIQLVQRSRSAAGRPLRFRTAPSWSFPDDKLSDIDRYVYEITAPQEGGLRFDCLKRYEEG